MYICIAGKNNIAVNSVEYILQNKIIDKDNMLIIPNPDDNGKDTWQKSLKSYSMNNKLNIVTFDEIYSEKDLIFLSLECNKIIKTKKFISNKLYNIHFFKLPEYKGMYTSVLPILNGEEITGVTLHKIDEGIDTGDIVDQITFKIDINDTARDLYFKYCDYAFELFKKNIENIITNKVKSYRQSQVNSSYYSKKQIDFKNINIDFNRTSFQIHNQLRAYIFKEYQLPRINGKNIVKTVLTSEKHQKSNYIEERDDWFIITGIDRYIIKAYKE